MSSKAKPEPIRPAERIREMDVLRGFALLGILVPNIQAFAMVSMAYRNPTAYGDFSGGNFLVWYLTNLLFEMKFMTLFSMLFGAGIVLMSSHVAESKARPWRLHYRRMIWLLLFGLAHAYLIWYGDILFAYAVTGMIVYWLRRMKPGWLIAIGLVMVGFGSAVSLMFGSSMEYWPPEEVAEFQREWQPPPEIIDEELEAYRGGWLDQMSYRAPNAFMFQTFLLMIYLFWRAGGLMLIGMALFKLGVITGRRSTRFYVLTAAISLSVGLPLVALENQLNLSRGFAMEYSFFYGNQINWWASLLVSSGYLAVIMLVCRVPVLGWLQTALGAVGRMAFTNYIAHSVICTTLFYGHGLGWFGHLERLEQAAVVVSVWLLQLVISPIWLSYFRFGPLEWLWRSLVYWKRQPMMKAR